MRTYVICGGSQTKSEASPVRLLLKVNDGQEVGVGERTNNTSSREQVYQVGASFRRISARFGELHWGFSVRVKQPTSRSALEISTLFCVTFPKYRDRLKGMQILLSRTQAGPGRTGEQEQEQASPNHVQTL